MINVNKKNSVVFLDDNADLCELIQSVIESQLSGDCFCFTNVAQMQNAERNVLASHVAILDIELGFQQPSGIEAYKWLKEKNYTGHIFFLTGHGLSAPLVQAAVTLGADIWEKPISSSKIVSDIKKVLLKNKETPLESLDSE